MKRSYEKPMLNASMNGTLEGVYAYGTFAGIAPATKGCGNEQPPEEGSKNPGCGNNQNNDGNNSNCIDNLSLAEYILWWLLYMFG